MPCSLSLLYGFALGLPLSSIRMRQPEAPRYLTVAHSLRSALFVAGATLDWLQHIGDHFAERSLGWRLLAASGPAHLSGMTIVTAGVVAV